MCIRDSFETRQLAAGPIERLAFAGAKSLVGYYSVVVLLVLYLFTGIATAIPVVWALGWALWGAPTSPTEYLSLLGSLILVVSALMNLWNRRLAARVALAGAFAVWSFYLPVIVGMVKTRLSDQELNLSVLLWTPSASPLTIHEQTQVPSFPNMRLSPEE